jgi:predicted Rossmann fold nucleotide-binding protein DprA/Smf involved in DNA uptake
MPVAMVATSKPTRRQTMPETDNSDDSGRRPGESVLATLGRAITPMTAKEVSDDAGLTPRQARDALAGLASTGRIERSGRGRYRLTVAPGAPKRRPYGSVTLACRNAMTAEPTRVWRASELAAKVGVDAQHALVWLCQATRRGEVHCVAPALYRVATPGDRPAVVMPPMAALKRWRTIHFRASEAVLVDEADESVWVAHRSVGAA